MQAGEAAGDQVQDVGFAGKRAEIHDFRAEGVGDELEKLFLRDNALFDDHLLDRFLRRGGFLHEGVSLVGGDPSRLHEHVGDLLGVHLNGAGSGKWEVGSA